MSKHVIHFTDYFSQTITRMQQDGLLLVSTSRAGKPNVMTIGWCSLGIMWGLPVAVVMVRPSRYTYQLLEEVPEFTINVPGAELASATRHCGTVSGASHNKFDELNLHAVPSRQVTAPVIQECLIHYECRIVHRSDMAPATLATSLYSQYYPEDDFHRYYFGQVISCYADKDVLARWVFSPI